MTRGSKKAQAAIASALENSELDSQLRSLRRLTKTAQQLRATRSRARGGSDGGAT